jgi:hypothetical protein
MHTTFVIVLTVVIFLLAVISTVLGFLSNKHQDSGGKNYIFGVIASGIGIVLLSLAVFIFEMMGR